MLQRTTALMLLLFVIFAGTASGRELPGSGSDPTEPAQVPAVTGNVASSPAGNVDSVLVFPSAPAASGCLIPNYIVSSQPVTLSEPPKPATPKKKKLVAWNWNVRDAAGKTKSIRIDGTNPYGKTVAKPGGDGPVLEAQGYTIINSNPIFDDGSTTD